MSSSLPARPSLEWLRKTAKERLTTLRSTRPAAKLAEAQLHVAREYGFSSWRALKAHVDATAKSEANLEPSPGAHAAPATPSAEQVVAAFLQQVGRGRIDNVKAMLAQIPTLVNAVGPHPFWSGRPQPLHVAIETTRREVTDLLLEHGADVNGANDDYDHWSPLMLAINKRTPAVQNTLIARGAHIGLIEALMLGDDARVDALLREGGLPDITPNGGSILAFARTPFAIDRLLALGAPTDLKDRWGSAPIDAFSRLGASGEPLVRHLVSRGVAAAPKEYARLGDLITLQRLITGDPAVAALDSVMMAAVDFRHHDMVDWLLAHGGKVNAQSDAQSRHTALHSAAWNGDLEMVKRLVQAGADPGACDQQYDATPRGWAETSIEVTNNQMCAEIVAYFDTLTL
jgi:ankyrin repeat protein